MSLVAVEDRGPVRHIVMERPEKRNALNRELVEGLGEAFQEAAEEESVRVVVLRGAGPMFSSGMDLGDLRDLSENADGLHEYRAPLLDVYNQLEEMMKPTIAQIQANQRAVAGWNCVSGMRNDTSVRKEGRVGRQDSTGQVRKSGSQEVRKSRSK